MQALAIIAMILGTITGHTVAHSPEHMVNVCASESASLVNGHQVITYSLYDC